MATSSDPTFETRALHLFRELLDMEADQREPALRGCEPLLQARVRALWDCMAEADLSAAGDAASVGLRIGPYVIEERIGQGGMGEVFLARRADGAYDRQVALKRIWAGHASLAARFLRERQALARLQHPHIAQLLDGGIDDAGKPWLAMELVRGEHVDAWCHARSAPLERRVELLRQVCDAVDYAHRNLVVHRDLKPANVLVDGDGQAKLLDFGIARLLDDAEGERTQTLAMTPAWATPEQRAGKPVTTASDLYQLGLLARVLLSGLPHGAAGARMSADFARLCRDDPARARHLAEARGMPAPALKRRLRGDLDSIVALATAERPEERYPSARALADDLKLWLRGRPVQARAEERGYRLRRAARRWWPALAAGVAAIGFLGYHVASLSDALQRAERERARAVAAERKAMQERDNARFVGERLVRMFAAASPAGTSSDRVSARELLDNAEASFRDAPESGSEPAAAALVWDALSRIHGGLGDDARALRLQERAVDAARRSGDPMLLAETLRTQAWAYFRHDQPARARASAETARRALDAAGMRGAVLYARVVNALGFASLADGRAQEGWLALDESIELLHGKDAAQYEAALMNGSEAALALGERARARAWLARLDALLAAGSRGDAIATLQYGMRRARLARMEDRLPEARSAMAALVEEAQGYFGRRHPESISYVLEYAKAVLADGDHAAAVALLAAAIDDAEAGLPAEHTLARDIRGLHGIALLAAGDAHAAGAELAPVIAWRRRSGMPDMGAGPALERIALARATCAQVPAAMGSAPALDAAHAEPWQRRLAQRWRRECAAGPR